MTDAKDVELLKTGEDRITIIFPPGTRVALRSRVPLEELLRVLSAVPEVEGQARLDRLSEEVGRLVLIEAPPPR